MPINKDGYLYTGTGGVVDANAKQGTVPSIRSWLIEGKDYFVFTDGTYYTTEALMKVHSCSDSNITQKVKKHNIDKKKIFDKWVYKNDIRFEKNKPGGNGSGKPFEKGDSRIAKIRSHNELCILSNQIDSKVDSISNICANIDHKIFTLSQNINDILNYLTKDNSLKSVTNMEIKLDE